MKKRIEQELQNTVPQKVSDEFAKLLMKNFFFI